MEISFGGHVNKTLNQVVEQVFVNSSLFINGTNAKKSNCEMATKILYPFGLCLQFKDYNVSRDEIEMHWELQELDFSQGNG